MSGSREVRVAIYDQEYKMRSDLDPEYVRKLAEYVDGKMRSIATRTQVVDSLRVAVLAALNLADEVHQLEVKQESRAREVEQRVIDFGQHLDEVLKQM